jgi:voltage-gated potassium channel
VTGARRPSAPARRRGLIAGVARAGASATLLVVGYYAAPLDGPLHSGTGIGFALGLAVLVLVLAWQVRAILSSDAPRLRAIQAVAVGLPLFVVLFAATYAVLGRIDAGSFTEEVGRTDALYFTVTVLATVGFGDIAPLSEPARIVVTIQMVLGLVAVGLVARIILGAVQVAVRRREGAERAGTGDGGPGG